MSIPVIGPYGPDDEMPSADMNELIASVEALYNSPNAQGVIEFPEMSIAHVNGTADNFAGIATLVTGGTAVASDGSNHLLLTPVSTKWKTLPFLAKVASMEVLSNVIAGDMAGSGGANRIIINLVNAYMQPANTANTGNAETVSFESTGIVLPAGGASPNGPQNAPLEVGDTATLHGTIQAGAVVNIGLASASVSNYYFTFNIIVPSTAATKTYKFKIYLKYTS